MLAGALLLGWTLALSVVDIRAHRLPNVLTLPGAAIILAVCALCGRWSEAATGGVALAGRYCVVHLANPASMGAGDVKLALGLGALTAACGPQTWLLGALGAPIVTAVVGVASLARGRGGAVPHGPSMCVASLVAVAVALA